jgi:hypothetical protein
MPRFFSAVFLVVLDGYLIQLVYNLPLLGGEGVRGLKFDDLVDPGWMKRGFLFHFWLKQDYLTIEMDEKEDCICFLDHRRESRIYTADPHPL